MPLLRLDYHAEEIDRLFDSWDGDQSGQLEIRELKRILSGRPARRSESRSVSRSVSPVPLPPAPEEEENVTRQESLAMRAISLEGLDDDLVLSKLRAALASQRARVIDIFRSWDDDESGTITKKELKKTMPMLGLTPTDAQMEQLFLSFDTDANGRIDLQELSKLLRNRMVAEEEAAEEVAKEVVQMESLKDIRQSLLAELEAKGI